MFDHDERLEMLNCFITESRELLDDIEPQIIALEEDAISSGSIDENILNAVFRLFHSLKGSASILGFQTITQIAHEAETLLDIFRSGQAVLEPGHVDLLIRAGDLVRTILDSIEQQQDEASFADDAQVVIKGFRKFIAEINQPGDEVEAEISLDITSEMIGHFVEESKELLEEAERALLELEKEPHNLEWANQAYRALHSFKGNAGFLSYGPLEEVSHHGETLLDQIRSGALACDAVAISFLLIAIDTLRQGVFQVEQNVDLELPGKQELCRYLSNTAAGALEDDIEGGQNPEPGGPQPDVDLENWPLEENIDAEVGAEKQKSVGNEKKQSTNGSVERSIKNQVIRVDLEKLDKLLDLVGELVISEAMVANNQDLKGLQLDGFEKAVLHLDKITRDIQEVAMSMRMIPLSSTFRKMVRLVRDLSQKTNRKVNLEILGEETEVDKTIIEQISDPLVHLIRNAVDHGIESPEERIAAGKPESGRLTLEAKHSAGEVWITIEDDGKGLDREKILQQGIKRGFVSAEEPDLKDEDVWRLIFEPGFSTAKEVSNISGRGVGMDVVKRNIEKLRGKVDVRSVQGAGTVFAIRIPLTLAIIEGMVVKIGPNRYTIPINSIKECLQPTADQITRMQNNLEVVSIRGDLLPVMRMHEIFAMQMNRRSITDGILVVVENGDKKCCLFVDEVVGQQQIVIKGLSSYLGQAKGFSGCAILGDGDVSLILDVDNLLNSAQLNN